MKITEAKRLSQKLLKKYGFHDWKTKITDTLHVMGRCNIKIKTIDISRRYIRINSKRVIKDLILHEIAHILAPMTIKEEKKCMRQKKCPCEITETFSPCHSKRWERAAKKIGVDVDMKKINIKIPKRGKRKKW